MIPESFIERLKQTLDIENIITPYAELKRAGRGHVCLCPFHSEKTPSCHVYTDSQSFFCFGCGAGGDAITFIRLIENLDYPEAVRFLAGRAGLTVPEDGVNDKEAGKKNLFLEMNKEAARFYRDVLHSERGIPGLDYLYTRGLNPNTIRKYGLGFAPAGWDALKNHMRTKNYTDDNLVEASLLVRGKSNVYDKFRNRVMFPLIDRRGNVIGFGGRVINPDDEPKYLNSSETIVFQKRLNLFSINFAKNTKENYLLLCEGNMDVITLNQAGFENAVATCGTAITAEQARLMRQYCEQVVIAYDADSAGQKAAEKAVNLLGQAGLSARVLDFSGTDVKDPDDYIRKYGREAFERLAVNSKSVISFELKKAEKDLNLDEPEGRAEYLKKAVVILAGIQNKTERAVYISETARLCMVQEQVLITSVNDRMKSNFKREEREEKNKLIKGGFQRSGNGQSGLNMREKSPEEGIIAYLFHSPDKLPKILSRLSPDDFPTEFNKQVLEMLIFRLKKGLSIDISALQSEFSPAEAGKIEAIKHKYSDVPYTDERLFEYIEKIEHLKTAKNKKSPADMTAEELMAYSAALKNR
ncbi:MAG: DNA primase [Oscillospiraceae bacterium]|nr:DNA primase [Oscillospiraceae bacterium]